MYQEHDITDRESIIISDVIARGIIAAIDGREDMRADCDALEDTRRTGARIADGFTAVNPDCW